MKITKILLLLQLFYFQGVYADLVEENADIAANQEEEEEDSEDGYQNDDNGAVEEDDSVPSEDVQSELTEGNSDDMSQAEDEQYEVDDQLRNFVIEQANQAATTAVSSPDLNIVADDDTAVENVEDEIPPAEEVSKAEPPSSEEKNIVEYKLPDPKDVKDQTKSVDAQKQFCNGKYVENAIELQNVVIQVLDKKSTKCELMKIELDKPVVIGKLGDLSVILKKAFMTPENVVPFSVIGYIEIRDPKDKDNKVLFSNWLCSTSTSGITFDHPLYDIKMTNEKNI